MKKIIYASKDTYITNRIIRGKFRATDANVGQGGTLDIFKLAGESKFSYVTASLSGSTLLEGHGPFVSGTTEPIELSRVLIKFDLEPIRALTSSILDLNNAVISSSFSCYLKMSDVIGGQPLPSNYSLVLIPLSKSFDEGQGRDVYAFEDIGACNFMTASVSLGLPVTWSQSEATTQVIAGEGATAFIGGASHLGYVGQELVDAVTGSEALGDMTSTQAFVAGDEDLLLDVTRIMSATLAGLLPDHGFRLSFIAEQETDDRTRFVKRFASRHSTNVNVRPRLEFGFNDSIQDNHRDFFFGVPGSLFFSNRIRGVLENVSGSNPLLLTLTTGSLASGTFYTTSSVASIHSTGIYSASFTLSSQATASLNDEVINAHSATFTEIWSSLDGSIGYYTGSLVIFENERSAFSNVYDRIKVNVTNMRGSFRQSEKMRFRIFAQDDGFKLKAVRLPIEAKSIIFNAMYYRIRDVNSNEIHFDFDTVKNSTRVSTDSDGMYFDLHMSDLLLGRVYAIDLMIDTHGSKQIFENVGGSFRIIT